MEHEDNQEYSISKDFGKSYRHRDPFEGTALQQLRKTNKPWSVL
jgi:hypothetical protein